MITKTYSQEEIAEMKQTFCDELRKINREGALIEDLISKLCEGDFFTAPASTKFHNCMDGGLVAHSLNVYNNLKDLVAMKGLQDVIPEDSIRICALLHDMSKMGYYEKTARNKKVYHEEGSKFDNLGKFDWVSEEGYQVKSWNERFIYGSHEANSEFMVRCYIPLKVTESVAFLNHHGSIGNPNASREVSEIFHRYPLAALLHIADMTATFVDEEAQ